MRHYLGDFHSNYVNVIACLSNIHVYMFAQFGIVSRFKTNSKKFELEIAFLFQFIQTVSFYYNVGIKVQMYMRLGVACHTIVI